MGLWCQGKPQRDTEPNRGGRAARGHQPRGQQEGTNQEGSKTLHLLLYQCMPAHVIEYHIIIYYVNVSNHIISGVFSGSQSSECHRHLCDSSMGSMMGQWGLAAILTDPAKSSLKGVPGQEPFNECCFHIPKILAPPLAF
jgi:hypothetical protein